MLPPMALPRMSWMLLSCLMLLSQVQGEDTKEESLPKISCPKGSYAFRSHCYALFRTAKTWPDANGLEPNADGWEWSNKDVMNYFAWEKVPASIPTSGHCGSLSRNSGYLFWKDYNCNEKLPYVCKFKG
ncbi:regenerating islet-derived protein 3-gamma-like isoform X2 [Myotis myotis]|uniref:regenerating islet-derived protein 3-gamma-like isoform X2 n=1 Tax=Myotis myotis TaxID=51298 RepID=UPI001749CB29|nr:regenerating islet-derived protein 3-gamma-like isoform X2 [Myotis myotis]